MRIKIPIISHLLDNDYQLSWRDAVAFICFLLLLWVSVDILRDINATYDITKNQTIDLSYKKIPYYMLRSTFRMFSAFLFSLFITFIFGSWAYHSKTARAFIIPIADILQSVPVLGFLSLFVIALMALFPNNLLAFELAALLAIFTGQVWNMLLGFYHSLTSIPDDLHDVALIHQLNPWQRFIKLECPYSAMSLVWNSMMSFGGGWFFVVQSEMITVLNKNIKLEGIGSYMGAAIESGNKMAASYAIVAMIITIVLIDFLFWKPVTLWSLKFKNEQITSQDPGKSFIYDLINQSKLFPLLIDKILNFLDGLFKLIYRSSVTKLFSFKKIKLTFNQTLLKFITACLVLAIIFYGANELNHHFSFFDYFHVIKLGSFTMLRVFLMVILSSLIWTPIGVWVGLNPKAAKVVRPLAQIGASFPINMTFPIIVGFFIKHNISINWGSIFLLSLGAQWYLLFNVIAGANSISAEMLECARIYKLKGLKRWRKLIIPAIFPYWVTGAYTAAGGAWNASIVAEYASFGKDTLIAEGLGAYITQVTADGNWNGIFLSIAMMSIFVTVINHFIWKKLYQFSVNHFHLE